MRRLAGWFRNLKKWQKGALIGCAVGLFLVCLAIILFLYFPPHIIPPPSIPYTILSALRGATIVLVLTGMLNLMLGIALFRIESAAPVVGIIVFYCVFGGVFGAIVGRVQQVASPFWRWLLTALLSLLALFLLFAYLFSFEFVWSFE
jgi:uncharacterized membrane protein